MKFLLSIMVVLVAEVWVSRVSAVLHVLLLVAALIGMRWVEDEADPVVVIPPVPVQTDGAQKTLREKKLLTEIIAVTNRIQSDTGFLDSIVAVFTSNASDFNIIHFATVLSRLSQVRLIDRFAATGDVWTQFCALAMDQIRCHRNPKTAASVLSHLARAGAVVDVSVIESFVSESAGDLDTSSLLQLAVAFDRPSVRIAVISALESHSPLSQSDLTYLISRNVTNGIDGLVRSCDKFVPQGFALVASFLSKSGKNMRNHVEAKFVVDEAQMCSWQDLQAVTAVTGHVLTNRAFELFFELPTSFIQTHLMAVEIPNISGFWKSVLAAVEMKSIDFDKLRIAICLLGRSGEALPQSFIRSVHAKLLQSVESVNAVALFEFLSVWREVDADCSPLISVAVKSKRLSLAALSLMLLESKSSDVPSTISADEKVRLGQVVAILAGLNNCRLKTELTGKYKAQLSRFKSKNVIEALNLSATEFGKNVRIASEGLEYGSFGPACRAASRTTNPRTKRDILSLAENQIPHVTTKVLIQAIPVLVRSEKLVAELTKRLNTGSFTLDDVVTVLTLYSESTQRVTGLDNLFQALQLWLVPRIPKLSLAEIGTVTGALENFGSRTTQDESDDVMTP